jgi:hypothetical protein
VAGVDLSYAMPFHPSMEVVLNADYMQSGVNADVEDYYQYVYSTRYSDCNKYLMELPRFRNIPIMMGVRYAYPVAKGIDLYGEALAGINLRRITNWTLAYATNMIQQKDMARMGVIIGAISIVLGYLVLFAAGSLHIV